MNNIIKTKNIFRFIALFVTTHIVFAYTPVMPNDLRLTPEEAGGQPNYMQAMRNGMETQRQLAETVYGSQMMAENLKQQQLQNQILQAEWENYLATHPKIAKDLKDKDEFKDLMSRNSRLFSRFSTYIADLKNCANHRNKYCQNKLNEELVKCKKRRRC